MKSKASHTFVLVIFACVLSFGSYAVEPDFGDRVDLGLIEYDPITEASGVAASRMNPDVLCTHRASIWGNTPSRGRVIAIGRIWRWVPGLWMGGSISTSVKLAT